MEGLIGSINNRLSRTKDPALKSPATEAKPAGLFAIPSLRHRTASPSGKAPLSPEASSADDHGADHGDDSLEVTKREDSAAYAARTLSEIETCLGFRIHEGAEAEAESLSAADIESLSTQVEAALASGLNFKDKLRSNSHKRLMVEPDADSRSSSDGGSGQPGSGDDLADDPPPPPAAAAPAPAAPAAAAAAPQGPGKGPGGPGKGPPKLGLGGLQLAVGSQMETGEWKTNGVWVKKEKQGNSIPTNLQTIPPDDLVKVKELGRGCFGSVWLAKWRGVEVALKEALNPGGTDTASMDIFSEAEKLASLRHPCVMGFYGIVTAPECYGTVAEYLCHGSLRSGLQKIRKKGLGDKRLRAYIALQASHGMEYLHRHDMVHFDLKCDNLLCDLRDLNKPVVKIGDVGLSKNKKGSFISGNMRGTLPWMAPELFPLPPGAAATAAHQHTEDRVTEKVDVFSFGIVLWEIWTLGEQPYPNKSLQEIFAGVLTGNIRPQIPPNCDPLWASLMQDCWNGNPRARPSFTDVVSRLEAMLQKWAMPPNPAAAHAAVQAAAAGGGRPAAAPNGA